MSKAPQKIAHPFFLILAVFFAIGVIAYLACFRAKLKMKISPTPAPEEIIIWKEYKNEKLGFKLNIPETYRVAKETDDSVELGEARDPNSDTLDTFLTITTNANNFEDFNKYKTCPEALANLAADEYPAPCIQEGKPYNQDKIIADTVLDGVKAKSFYLDLGVANQYHIVQTEGSPTIQLKMFIAGSGFESFFNHMLSTFKFFKDQLTG